MDATIRKKVLRSFSYGLYILTARSGDNYGAATVTWVSQASFEPLLISVAIRKDSGTYQIVKSEMKFVLNVVGEGQKDLAAAFFKDTEVSDDHLNGYRFKVGELGLPCLTETPYYLECTVREICSGGDHDIFVSEVKQVGLNSEAPALALKDTGWSYGG